MNQLIVHQTFIDNRIRMIMRIEFFILVIFSLSVVVNTLLRN